MSQIANGAPRGGAGVRGGRGRGRGGAVKRGGPAPARHIPWPEIFKHHISLVEGHLKMIDMVRKHTVEGTGNHQTISSLVERAREMLKDAKATERAFEAPREAWKKVPIGSSSDTMYPGYSPKDHEYGKAAEEFGKGWSEAQQKGIAFKTDPDGPEYQFGQSKGAKRRRLSGDEPRQAKLDTGLGGPTANIVSQPPTADITSASDSNLFFFDSNPAPINGKTPLGRVIEATHPSSTSTPKSERPSKRAKKSPSHSDPLTHDGSIERHPEPIIEYDNIDREVDARLKLKEEAKSNKKDKKRKRESAISIEASESAITGSGSGSGTAAGNDTESKPLSALTPAGAETIEKPAKKKSKNARKEKGKTRDVETANPKSEAISTAPVADVDVDVEMQDAPPHGPSADAAGDDNVEEASGLAASKDKDRGKEKKKKRKSKKTKDESED